jgi:hypothetical protein
LDVTDEVDLPLAALLKGARLEDLLGGLGEE